MNVKQCDQRVYVLRFVQLICIELSEMRLFIVKYALKFSVFVKYYIISFCNIRFCQSIPPYHIKDI